MSHPFVHILRKPTHTFVRMPRVPQFLQINASRFGGLRVTWDRQRGVWCVPLDSEEAFLSLLSPYFPPEHFCPFCLRDAPCRVWPEEDAPSTPARETPRENPFKRTPFTLPPPVLRACLALGIAPNELNEKTLKRQFSLRAIRTHSDTGGSDEAMKKLLEMREILTAYLA